jgi:PilZ domain
MEEKRKAQRRYLLYYTRVYDAASRQQIGHLVDITHLGAMIISPDPLTEGQALRLRIELSDDIADKPHMDLPVRTKWCHPDLDPSLYNIGVEIENATAEDLEIIRRIVETYGFRDNQPTRQ